MDKQQHFSLWYFIGVALLLLLMQLVFLSPHVETVSYSDFKVLAQAGKVRDVVIDETTITGTVTVQGIESLMPEAVVRSLQARGGAEQPFATIRVTDPGLVADLTAAKVRFAGRVENKWLAALLSWVAPMLLFVLLWSFLVRRMGGGLGQAGGLMAVGKSRAKVFVQKETGVKFADVEGIDEAKQELMEVVDFLKTPERYRRLGGRLPKGVLIVGAPGTGKTLLARAVAGEAGVPFLSISGSEFVEMFVGVGAARVRDLFERADQLAPCIIFIDELDALGKSRGFGVVTGNDEREQTLNQLLVEMDGFDTNKGVIIMAATNRPEILDPALLRPGRFDRHVAIDRPDIRGREKILRVHVRQLTLGPDVDLAAVAARTPGFAGADLANLVNEAALRAARTNKSAVGMADFEEAIERIVAGLEKKTRVMNPKEKETVAYHEAGHALIAEARPGADRVAKISIIPRGIGALGYTRQQPTEDRYLLKRSELLDRLDVLLGGRAAEDLVFGEVSTGARDDLQRATDLVRHMVTQYGMSEALGPATLDAPRQPTFLPGSGPAERAEYSERTAAAVDGEIRQLLDASEQRVRTTLTAQRALLDAIAQRLLREEAIDRATLAALIAAENTPGRAVAGEARPAQEAGRGHASDARLA